jgi:hypothetical protein
MRANHIRHDSLNLVERYRGWAPEWQGPEPRVKVASAAALILLTVNDVALEPLGEVLNLAA